jgi:hypothetical protein
MGFRQQSVRKQPNKDRVFGGIKARERERERASL